MRTLFEACGISLILRPISSMEEYVLGMDETTDQYGYWAPFYEKKKNQLA